MFAPITKKTKEIIGDISIKIGNDLSEDELYEIVGKEMKEGDIKEGLWVMAKAKAMGDDNKIEPLYIKYRVKDIKNKAIEKEELLIKEKKKKILEESEKRVSDHEVKNKKSVHRRGPKVMFIVGLLLSVFNVAIIEEISSPLSDDMATIAGIFLLNSVIWMFIRRCKKENVRFHKIVGLIMLVLTVLFIVLLV